LIRETMIVFDIIEAAPSERFGQFSEFVRRQSLWFQRGTRESAHLGADTLAQSVETDSGAITQRRANERGKLEID
jgi:hypothetical protein